MVPASKWSAALLVGFSFLLLGIWAFCQNKTQLAKEADDVPCIEEIIERVKRNSGDIRGEDLDGLWKLFRKLNPQAAAVIVSHPYEPVRIGFSWFLIGFCREKFRQSLLELCDSSDEDLAKHVGRGLLETSPVLIGTDYLGADITDPWEILRTDKHFIFRYLKAGKELPQLYVDSIYAASPAFSLAAMFYAHHLVQCEHPEKPMREDYERIDNAYRDVRWVIHLVEVARWRKKYHFLTPEEIAEVQQKLKWLWGHLSAVVGPPLCAANCPVL